MVGMVLGMVVVLGMVLEMGMVVLLLGMGIVVLVLVATWSPRLLPGLLVYLGSLLHDTQPIPTTIKSSLQVPVCGILWYLDHHALPPSHHLPELQADAPG